MTSIITGRHFVLKSPDEIVKETLKNLIDENEKIDDDFFRNHFKNENDDSKNILKKSVYVKPIVQPTKTMVQSKNKRYFIHKFYI